MDLFVVSERFFPIYHKDWDFPNFFLSLDLFFSGKPFKEKSLSLLFSF